MTNIDKPDDRLVSSSEPHNDILFKAAYGVGREIKMVGSGVGSAIADTIQHPWSKAPELGISAATGAGLGVITRLGTPGKIVAASAGAAMALKFGYDELSNNRWSTFGKAVADTWQSGANMNRNIAATRDSLGSFAVDMAIGAVGMKIGGPLTSRYAPPGRTLDWAVKRADLDNGVALRRLQDRWENPRTVEKAAAEGKLEIVAHSEPAVPGEARGDLFRVLKGPDGRLQMYSMDATGHGTEAAKFSGTLQGAIDHVMPQTRGKSASEMLALVDKKVGDTETSSTAALSVYNPLNHELQTATASSQLAYVIRSTGEVKQLDKEIGGFVLGQKMYNDFPNGNEITRLNKGDTVIMVSDGVFDRFPNQRLGFEDFLRRMGPKPHELKRGILGMPSPATGVDDTSFVIFRRPF